MTRTTATTQTYLRDPLGPVRQALLDDARRDAEAMLADADAAAAGFAEEAAAQARAMRESARALGEADAEATVRAERTGARRRARALLLRAQRDVYDEIRRRALQQAGSLRDDAAYAQAVEGLTTQARAVLGPEATVTEHPSGGVVAELGSRRLSFTVEGLVDEAIGSVGDELQGLWVS